MNLWYYLPLKREGEFLPPPPWYFETYGIFVDKRNQFSSLYLDLYNIGFNNSFVSLPFLCTIAFGCSKKVNFSIIDKSKVMQIQNIVFWTCCSFAYLKHVWLYLNTRIVLGHKILLLPFILHLFLEKKSESGPDKGKIQDAKFE